jgi:hypothetical protein
MRDGFISSDFTGLSVQMFAFFVVVGSDDDLLVIGEAAIVTHRVHDLAAGASGLQAAELVDGAV